MSAQLALVRFVLAETVSVKQRQNCPQLQSHNSQFAGSHANWKQPATYVTHFLKFVFCVQFHNSVPIMQSVLSVLTNHTPSQCLTVSSSTIRRCSRKLSESFKHLLLSGRTNYRFNWSPHTSPRNKSRSYPFTANLTMNQDNLVSLVKIRISSITSSYRARQGP